MTQCFQCANKVSNGLLPRKIKPSAADRLIDLRNRLLKQGNSEESQKLDVIIANTISEEGQKKAIMFRKYCNRNESGILSDMWNLKKKLLPKKP